MKFIAWLEVLVGLSSCEKAVGSCTAQYRMLLFYVKTVKEVSASLLSRKHFSHLAAFQFGASMLLFTTRTLFGHENT